jgi:hypothetical protein
MAYGSSRSTAATASPPDVSRDVESGRPDACTSCHVGESALWAADAMRRWWGDKYGVPAARPDHAPLELPEALASLHAGDAVQRAVAAVHLGRDESVLAPGTEGAALAPLVSALGDGYPAIRTLARRSLRALDRRLGTGLAAEIEAFDVFAPQDVRRERLLALLERVRAASRARLPPARWRPPLRRLRLLASSACARCSPSVRPRDRDRRMSDPATRRALRTGWVLIAISLPLGVTLEALHGFKVQVYLRSEVRHEMWRLAHAHGTLLGILLLVFASLGESHLAAEKRAAIGRDLRTGSILMPLGFFLGGILNSEGDPSLGILLVPLGALFLLAALVRAAGAVRR